MKVELLQSAIVCQNKNSIHSYFGWPTVGRLQDGRLAMVASGFRIAHICPFGKGVICYSEDEGQTWSSPTIIIDTPLDDRDCGLCTFGENGVMVTSFNNTADFQRKLKETTHHIHAKTDLEKRYIEAYLNLMESRFDEKKYLGSTYVMSYDGGKHFETEVNFSPVSCPHGPCKLPDGNLLYVGHRSGVIEAHWFNPYQKTFEKRGTVAHIGEGFMMCEPHAICVDGKVIVHIRCEKQGFFTTFQTESYDFGMTFTQPHQIVGDLDGAPAHLLQLSNGDLLSVYSFRSKPYCIKAMISHDNGETWDINHVIFETGDSEDIGYPSSVELKDGSILTTFYTKASKEEPAVVMQRIWKIVE